MRSNIRGMDAFLVHCGYADKLQRPVVAPIRQVIANLMPVKVKASGSQW